MARMPGVVWIGPTPNRNVGAMGHIRGLVLHVQQGNEQGSESWLRNPASQASAHFLNPKVGGLRQLVDTADKAWAQADGNGSWVSVENEGLPGQSLTASQVENCAELLVWLHTECGVPLASTDNPDGSGLGWHGMGGQAWGGHLDCPGDPIKAQRRLIVSYAIHLLARPVSDVQEDDEMILITHGKDAQFLVVGPLCIGLGNTDDARALQKDGIKSWEASDRSYAEVVAQHAKLLAP